MDDGQECSSHTLTHIHTHTLFCLLKVDGLETARGQSPRRRQRERDKSCGKQKSAPVSLPLFLQAASSSRTQPNAKHTAPPVHSICLSRRGIEPNGRERLPEPSSAEADARAGGKVQKPWQSLSDSASSLAFCFRSRAFSVLLAPQGHRHWREMTMYKALRRCWS